jgi:hypothetical protein
MLEIIKAQLKSRNSLNQSRYYSAIDKTHFPKYHWDLYPVAQDYYHELNPVFLSNLYKKEFLSCCDVYMIRDGILPLSSFLLSHMDSIIKSKKHFLIPKSAAHLIHDAFRPNFSCYNITQPEKIHISEAKRVLVFGLMTESYLGPINELKARIEHDFKLIHPDTRIELLLTQRQDPFIDTQKEHFIHFELIEIIRELLPNAKFNYIKLDTFLDLNFSAEDFFYDLKYDNSVVSDSFLHHFFASKKTTVNLLPEKAPEDTLISSKLNFWHQVNIFPFPTEVKSIYPELLFYKKRTSKYLLHDKEFHKMVRSP